MNEVRPVTVNDLFPNAERLEDIRDLRGVERRRREQLLRTAKFLASELSDDLGNFRVSATSTTVLATGLFVHLSMLGGSLRVVVPDEAGTLLLAWWGEKAAVPPALPVAAKLSFLVAQRLARHGFGSRYGVRLLGTGAANELQFPNAYHFEVLMDAGKNQRSVWRIELDHDVTERLDWHARRSESACVTRRWRRFQQLLNPGEKDEPRDEE